MNVTIKNLNKQIQKAGMESNTEVTSWNGEYFILHVCGNGWPIPVFHSKDIKEVQSYLGKIIQEGK